LELRRKLAIEVKNPSCPAGFYAEATEIFSDPRWGNVLGIVPVGPDSLRFTTNPQRTLVR
jgi:hypothetical protein